MALIFSGSSPCTICGNILQETDDMVSWPAFLNPGQKFWEYSDSGMHMECFESWENKDEFEELYKHRSNVDFNDPWLQKQIKDGMPDWLEDVTEYWEKKAGK